MGWRYGICQDRYLSNLNDKIITAIQEHDYEKGIGNQAKIKAACEKLNEQIGKFNNEKCDELEGLSPYQREDCPQ